MPWRSGLLLAIMWKVRPMNEWETMETAPRDGTVISVWHHMWKCPISVRYVISNAPCKWIEATLTTQWPEEAFTHWMPLPISPADRMSEA